MKPSVTSTRLAGLEKHLADFWRHVEEEGAPLVEPIEDEPGWYLVTFLRRDQGDGRTAIILGGPGHWDAREDVLRRLPASDVWFRTYRQRSDWRGSYHFLPHDSPSDLRDLDDWSEFSDRFEPDPLNPRKLVWPKEPNDPKERDVVLSIVELPDAPPQPWFASRPEIPAGAVEEHRIRSEILGNERSVWVYIPPGYTAAGPAYGLALLFDGRMWALGMPIAPTFDNLLAESKTPPLVAVMVGNVNRDVELTCHQPFTDFLVRELVPWVWERWHVTHDPARVITAGQSFGGLAAAFAALKSPETIGNVLGQSTSCWWKDKTDFDLEAEWLTQEFVRSPKVPIRFYLEVGMMETGRSEMLTRNRHFRDILDLKGYNVTYHEYNGGHDYLCWRGGLADGLIALAADWTGDTDRGDGGQRA